MDKKNKAQDHLKPPFHAYKGDDPYIFVSYAHVDAKRVFPELIRFHNQGYNIWFDQGISPGNEWPEEIEAALLKSSLFVVFLSESSVKSYNVRNEINLAIDEGIPFISIYLEDTELKYGLRLRLSSIQGILKYSTPEEEYVSKYISAFKREGIVPSKKSKIEIIDDMDEILIPEDKDKYVFASYDKRDEELVLPELKKLRMQGLDIKCINFENEWSEDTEQKILESSLFLVFITSNSINSLIVRDEISLAHLEDIPFIAIYLEEVELKYGLKLQMASKESIYKYDMDEEEYVQRYTNSFMRHGFKLTDLDAFKTTGEKYIYASFDVKDKYDALSQIEEFTSSGLNIEYDLSDGENEENIDKLLNASLYLVFITPNSIRSNIVRDEIYLALSEDIPFIAIYLSETKITTGLKRQLDLKLTIFKYMLDENQYVKSYTDAFKKYGFQLIDKAPDSSRVKKPDERLNNEYLKEFDKLNTTTKSIFELDNHKVLIILKDGTNLTNWDDVKNKEDIIYISEDLSDYTNLSGKYDGLKSLKAIITPKVAEKFTTLKFMFNGCESLVDISSLNNWNISKVINFNSMFKGCSSLVDLSPLKEWDVSRVTNFNSMFEGCSSLADLSHLNNWNISQKSNVRMEHTFDTGNSLREYPKWYEKNKSEKSTTQNKKPLEVPSSKEEEKTPPKKDKIADERLTSEYLKEFEKLNVTTDSIFELGNHKVLIILKDGTNLTKWDDVKNKEDIIYISEDLSGFTDLNRKYNGLKSIKAIVTSNISDEVTDMEFMFGECSSLADISTLQMWDTSNVTSMKWIFSDCSSLADISSLKNWNTSKVTNMMGMFEGCSSLSDVSSLENWKTSKVTKMLDMFKGCSSLKDVSGLKNWDTTKVTSMREMFKDCSSLKDVSGLKNWNTSKVTSMREMFKDCSSLNDISGLKNWNTSKVTHMNSMFEKCSSLSEVTGLKDWNTSNVTHMNSMFRRCSSLIDLSPLSNWDTSNANKKSIFAYCKSIKTYPSWDERSESEKSKKELKKTSDNKDAVHVKTYSELVDSIKKGSEIIIDSDISFNSEIELNADNLVINGNGHTFDGGGTNRFFTITGKNIMINSLTFKNGFNAKNYEPGPVRRYRDTMWRGGAIYNYGSCTFNECKFINNVAGKDISHLPDRATAYNTWYARGGAIYSEGDCTLINCIFKGNEVYGENLGSKNIAGSYTLINSTLDGKLHNPNKEMNPKSAENAKDKKPKDKTKDKRLTSEYLKEFEKLNTTTESIFELGEHKVLIILKDGTNLTRWEDVKDKDHISYISEDLSDCTSLKEKYARFSSLKAIVTSDISDKVTSLFRMFEDCLSLKDITGLQNWNTKNITDMNKMFEGCSSLTDITPLQNWKTNNVIDMNAMFFRCSSLTDITPLQNWKTNKVNNMRFMFCGCLSLTDITPLQNWKTNNVMDMSWMFEGCSSLTDITPLQNWKTNNVMDMRSMFERCSSLVDLSPLSNWNTSKADKTGIFKDCSSIETYPSWDERSKSKKDKTNDKRLTSEYLKEFEKLNTTTESIFELGEHKVLIILKDGTNLTKWDNVQNKEDIVYVSENLSDDTSLKGKYSGLKSLKAIVTSDLPDKITSLYAMFDCCSSLKDITSLKNWSTEKITDMRFMFSDCSSLTDITFLKNWNTKNVTNISGMFYGCSSLKDITSLKNWDTENITDMRSMFKGCSSLKDLTGLKNWDTENITDMRNMFEGCSSLKDLTGLKNWNTENVTNMDYMFEGCSSLTDITGLQNWNTSKTTDMIHMFNGCSSLVDLSPLSNWSTYKTNKKDMFLNCKSVKIYPSWDERNKSHKPTTSKDITKDKRLTSEYLKEFERLNTTTESIFELGEYKVLIILKDGTNLTDWNNIMDKDDIIYVSEDLSAKISLKGKYAGLKSLKAIVTSNLPDGITSLYEMFRDCSSLKDITSLQNWNTKNIRNLEGMFDGCSSLTDITCLQNWNTENITNMVALFYGCSSLTDITSLQNWDISKVTTTRSMFDGCSSLKDITPLQNWSTKNITNIQAMFDGCFSLTDITCLQNWNTDKVTDMSFLFRDCSSLTDITILQNWNTDNVTTIRLMFYRCSSLTDITCLQNWNTNKVISMYRTFNGCSSLTDITCLQNWNTDNVTDMEEMFKDCSSLVDLSPLSNWNTSKAAKTGMFDGCSSIETYPSWDERSNSTPQIYEQNTDKDNSNSTDESSNDDSSNKGFFNKLKKSFFR